MRLKVDENGVAVIRGGRPVYVGKDGKEVVFDYAESQKAFADLTELLFTEVFSRSKFVSEKMSIPPDMVASRFRGDFSLDRGRIIAKDASGNVVFSRHRPGEYAEFDEALEILVGQYEHKDRVLKPPAAVTPAPNPAKPNGEKQTITRAQFDALDPMVKAKAVRESIIVDSLPVRRPIIPLIDLTPAPAPANTEDDYEPVPGPAVKRTISRAEFDKLEPAFKRSALKEFIIADAA